MKAQWSKGRDWLERIYDRLLFDFYWKDVINWESRETIVRLMHQIPAHPPADSQMTIEERYGTIDIV